MPKSNFPDVAPPAPVLVRVWDLPLRLFHWLLVACLIGSFATIKTGNTETHMLFGYSALTLILFRLLWGIFGPRYARFTSFVFSPMSLLAYLRGSSTAPRTLGHSPTGALSVFALIAVIGLQATTGLFTSDDIASEGPLARWVSNASVETASWIHHANERVILGLVGLHLAAIAFYTWVKRTSLVKPMVVGDKFVVPDRLESDPARLAAQDGPAVRLRALAVLALAGAIVALVVNWPVA